MGVLKKWVGKGVNFVTGGNDSLNKALGVVLTPVTGGMSVAAANEGNKMIYQKEADKIAAENAAEQARLNKEYADYEKKIIGQRAQRIENASQSRTDFTSEDEEVMEDPRMYKTDRLLAKKRKLIGFE